MIGRLLTLALLVAAAGAGAAPDGADRAAQLDAWWQGQRRREAAERFWNGPTERRRDATRDQIERWERDRARGQGRRATSPYD